MFSLFKRDSNTPIPTIDKVWKTTSAAQKGMLMMALMRLQQQLPVLILTFFDDEKQNLLSFMHQNQIDCKEVDISPDLGDWSTPQIYIANDEVINNSAASGLLQRNAGRMGKTVFFPGHYPVISHENKTLTKLSSLGFESYIFCLSFDDPMMGIFNIKNILPLLEKLGLDENESIEHSMVSKSIERARKKIDEKVKREVKAKSAAEWFALNMKS